MAKKVEKIYILDTSVILYDHNSFRNFQDNNEILMKMDNQESEPHDLYEEWED